MKIRNPKSETPNYSPFRGLGGLATPALIVYPARVKHNLELVKSMIDDVARLRPHVKTHKCREATLLCMAAGINKFKCATIAEAEMLGMCKVPDILLAYQPVGPNIERLIELIINYPLTRFSCLVDAASIADQISSAALKRKIIINVLVDINCGMDRTGILPDGALQLYHYCRHLNGIQVLGLHAYDGHIHDADFAERELKCNAAYKPVEGIATKLRQEGIEPLIVVGGTPTFPIHAKRKDVECSPGTFIYWDDGYGQACAEQQFLPAALVISRIVSLPGENIICTDLGHKAVAAENVLQKRVRFLNAPGLTPISQSEEHLVLKAPEGHQYKIGDVLYGLPYHICPTVALHQSAITIEDNQISGQWETIARNRKINI